MTISNKITLSRIFLIPIMIIILFIPGLEKELFLKITISQLIFTILFFLASFTDFLDGYIARKRNEVTTFGKFLDPIADKLLVLTGFIFLVKFSYWNSNLLNLQLISIGVIIILLREFMVTGVRLLASEKGHVIAASKLGKAKTVSTMISNLLFLFNGFNFKEALNINFDYLTFSFFLICVVLTIISGIDYLYKNRKIVLETI